MNHVAGGVTYDKRNRHAQDWLFVIGKLDIHGYIIEGLSFELFDRTKVERASAFNATTDLRLLKLVGDAL
jgi:hypothetical protein